MAKVDPKFNIHEIYTRMHISNPFRSEPPAASLLPKEANLVRFYKLNETTGDAIDEKGNFNGTVVGGMVRDGSAYTGNGTDAYIACGNTTEVGAYSTAMRFTTSSDVQNLQFVATKYRINTDKSMYMHIYQGNLLVMVNSSTTIALPIIANTTYEIVTTALSNGNLKIYSNRVLMGTLAIPAFTGTNASLLLFGRGTGTFFAKVAIDYFAMWDVELAQADIDQIPTGTI